MPRYNASVELKAFAGIDQSVGAQLGQLASRNKRATELGGQRPAVGLGAIGNEHPGPGLDQAKAHRPGGATGPEDQDRAAGELQLFAQGLV